MDIKRQSGNLERPLLTICLPSYNRGQRVRALVRYLLPTIEQYAGDVEILVSNNVSEDGTDELLSDIESAYFRLHNRVEHLPSAEEHIFECRNLCNGDYVWFLGDDDIPNIAVFGWLMELLREGEHDFLFFNAHLADGFGVHFGTSVLHMNARLISAPFDSIAPSLGFTSSFAGISNVVCRHSRLSDHTWREVVAISPIYSHVVWWYVSFAHTTAAVVNAPLVLYRVDDTPSLFQDFAKISTKLGKNKYFFWGEGLIRLFMYMEDLGAINTEQIRRIWETRRDGTQFRLLDNILNTLFQHVVSSARSTELTDKILTTDVRLCTDWMLRVDPTYFEQTRMIWLAHSAEQMAAEDAEDRLDWVGRDFSVLLEHKMAQSNKYVGISRMYRGFDIYRHLSGSVAIRQGSGIDRWAVLGCVDPLDQDDVLVSSIGADIDRRIDSFWAKAADQRIGRTLS